MEQNLRSGRFGRMLPVLVVLASAIFWTACNKEQNSKENASETAGQEKHVEVPLPTTPKTTFTEVKIPPKPEVNDELLAQGKKAYEQNCAVCHGDKGDGKGPAAAFLLPPPRDFVQAQYRLRSTPSGNLPTDEDLFRSISHGMPGTPMPPWQVHLSDQDRWALVEYIKKFSPRFDDPEEDRNTVVDLGNPPLKTDQLITEGKTLFVTLCAPCHGEQGRGDGPAAASLVNDAGKPLSARDFTKPSNFKSGHSPKEIARTILTGFNGTPMVGFYGAITNADAWKIAYYVASLAKPEVRPRDQASRDPLLTGPKGIPDVKIKVIERAWKYYPDTIRVKKGQVVEVTFEPTDNGLGVGHGFAISGYDEVAFMNGAMVGAPKKVVFKADQAGEFTFYCSTQCSTDKLHPLMNGTFIVEEGSTTKTASAK